MFVVHCVATWPFYRKVTYNTERIMKLKFQDIQKRANVSSAPELNEAMLTTSYFTNSILVTSFVDLIEENVDICKSALQRC